MVYRIGVNKYVLVSPPLFSLWPLSHLSEKRWPLLSLGSLHMNLVPNYGEIPHVEHISVSSYLPWRMILNLAVGWSYSTLYSTHFLIPEYFVDLSQQVNCSLYTVKFLKVLNVPHRHICIVSLDCHRKCEEQSYVPWYIPRYSSPTQLLRIHTTAIQRSYMKSMGERGL